MTYYDEEDREKPDWREIDKMKDRSKHVDKDREKAERADRPKRVSYAQKQYKKKLEEFFSIGKNKEDKQKQDELKKIKDIKNRNAFMKAASEYVEKNGFPRDFDFLIEMLDHKESEKVIESMRMLEALFKDETETRKDMIKQKVHILGMTSSDPKIQGAAEETYERMKSA